MYENRTQDALLSELRSRLGGAQPIEGTLEDVATRSAAYLGSVMFGNLDRLLSIAFPTRESGEAILWRAADFGIERKPGSFAQSEGFTLLGKAGTVIPAGTAFVTEAGLVFASTAAAALGADGTATATVRAAEIGTQYNVASGAIFRMMTSVPGLVRGTNANPAVGGMDAESYESVFDRLSEFRKRPATSGNLAQYEQWAREVGGVGDARALDCWAGAGTVKLVLIDMELKPVTEAVRKACAEFIETKRPAGGVRVSVASAQSVPIDLSVRVKLDTSATVDAVTQALRRAAEEYLRTLTFRAGTLVFNRLVYILMGLGGVTDFSALTLCGGTQNMPLGAEQVPVLRRVEVSVDASA